jgi:SNF2 family DNA or RNA helicase
MKVHDMLKPFMLRRIKADVEKTVPLKIEKKIMCPLTKVQTLWYKKFLLKDSTLLVQLENEEGNEPEGADTNNNNSTQSKLIFSFVLILLIFINHTR